MSEKSDKEDVIALVKGLHPLRELCIVWDVSGKEAE